MTVMFNDIPNDIRRPATQEDMDMLQIAGTMRTLQMSRLKALLIANGIPLPDGYRAPPQETDFERPDGEYAKVRKRFLELGGVL